jgi:hypothetical protein
MKPRFVADGAERLWRSEEFQAKLRALHDSIHAKYAAELSTAGLVRRCVLRWRIGVEFRRERQRIVPSSQSLYGSSIVISEQSLSGQQDGLHREANSLSPRSGHCC